MWLTYVVRCVCVVTIGQAENAVVDQSNASLGGGWSLLRRAFLYAFADSGTSTLFPYHRVLGYLRAAKAAGHSVYEQLV